MLEINRLSSSYGPIRALRDVSMRLEDGEAVAVLGPNGAGKSTLLRTISGLVKGHGSITFHGHQICGRPPEQIVRMGIVQVPEGRRIFTQLTVLENLMMGAFTQTNSAAVKADVEFVYELFPDLLTKRNRLGKELSGGQQQMLAIGRGLMSRPKLLLLDEPSLGLSPILVEQVAAAITQIRKDLGMSIILVEQNVGIALEMTSRLYVMQTGRIALAGAAGEVSAADIRRAYLGEAAAPAPA